MKEKIKLGIPIENEATGETNIILRTNEIRIIEEALEEIERLNNIIIKVKDYIRSKSIKFTMAYVEDDGRIDLSRSDYRIDRLTSKQVKELLEILKGSDNN